MKQIQQLLPKKQPHLLCRSATGRLLRDCVPKFFAALLLTGALLWQRPLPLAASYIAALPMGLPAVVGTFGAIGGYLLRKNRLLALLCPILSNTIIVPFVLKFAYGAPDALWFLFGSVAVGEVISCGILGMLLLFLLQKYRHLLFRD